jgi:deoxycytidylate deaminase
MTLGEIPEQPPQVVIDLAVQNAMKSPCAKSKRGVVIYSHGLYGELFIDGVGFNGPPWPFECDGSDACKRDCPRVAVHAEQRAIYAATDLSRETFLVHVKVVDGELVPGKGPCCDQCSKLILDAHIRHVWLYEDGGNGVGMWIVYEAAGFHRVTLRACGLHVVL